MILCEQCGNEFHWGKLVHKNGKELVSCPYCRYYNQKPLKGGKNKKVRKDTTRNENREQN